MYPYDTTGTAPSWWNGWELKGHAVRRTSADNQTPLISENGKFRLEITESGNLVLMKGVKACTGKTKSGVKYVKAADKAKSNSYYLYKTEADMKMDKLFIGQKNNNVGTLKRLNELSNDIVKGNNYMKYDDYAPTDTNGSTMVESANECQTKCSDDKSCNYYYSYVTDDDAINCKTGTNTGVKQFIPIQPNSGIKSSELYIRNSRMNLPENDIRNAIRRQNVNDYASYSAYEVSPTLYNLSSDAIMSDAYVQLVARQKLLVNGTNGQKEGFNNHGFKTNAEMTNFTAIESEGGARQAVITHQINPMEKIANDYYDKLIKMDEKYNQIDTNINAITNISQTGLRDTLQGGDYKGSGYQFKKDASGNLTSEYLDDKYDMGPPMKKAIDVRLDDIDEMISQTNTIYSLGTVTAMTLLIAGIFLARN